MGYKDQVEQYVSRMASAEQRGKKGVSSDLVSPRARPATKRQQEFDQRSQIVDDYVPLHPDELSIPGRKTTSRPKVAIDQWEEQPAFPARPGTAGIKKVTKRCSLS